MQKVFILLMTIIVLGVGVKETSSSTPIYSFETTQVRIIDKEYALYTVETMVFKYHRPYQYKMYSTKDYDINDKVYVKIYENGDVEE